MKEDMHAGISNLTIENGKDYFMIFRFPYTIESFKFENSIKNALGEEIGSFEFNILSDTDLQISLTKTEILKYSVGSYCRYDVIKIESDSKKSYVIKGKINFVDEDKP